MATFYAEVEFTLINTIKIEMPDGEIPTQEDIEDAMCYVDNVVDHWSSDPIYHEPELQEEDV